MVRRKKNLHINSTLSGDDGQTVFCGNEWIKKTNDERMARVEQIYQMDVVKRRDSNRNEEPGLFRGAHEFHSQCR